MGELTLTTEEQAMLAGAEGPGVKRAMEIVVALARIYGAADLAPVTHVQIAGVSYKNLGDAGVRFLSEWADEGARVRVPTTLNPMGMERGKWQAWGIQSSFATPQLSVIDAFEKMGVTPTMSCTPYLFAQHTPKRGDALAWAESSAVAYANSVIGARSNREGGPSAIAAAIAGRTARYGYHLDENRRANWIVEVRCPVKSVADFGALSYTVGKAVGNGVPWFADLAAYLTLPPPPSAGSGQALPSEGSGEQSPLTLVGGGLGWGPDRLKTLGAGLAAYGAVAVYHVAGYTPEARDLGASLIRPDAQRLTIDSLDAAYRVMDADPDLRKIDLVTIGCPHASLTEIEQVAGYLAGKTLATRLWVTTGEITRQAAAERGYVQTIEAAGGEVVADTCAVVAPMRMLDVRSMATNAGKMACYAPMHSGVRMRFGDLDACLDAAVTGEWLGERVMNNE
jgi:predicted aconitase